MAANHPADTGHRVLLEKSSKMAFINQSLGQTVTQGKWKEENEKNRSGGVLRSPAQVLASPSPQ